MNNPIIDVITKCKSRTEYDTPVPSENIRLQIGEVAADIIDIRLLGELAGKLATSQSYQLTITAIPA
jgi:hypothetical protein